MAGEVNQPNADACHKLMAAQLFNLTWDLLDKPQRTAAEDDRMVHAAHASRFHWGEIGQPVHRVRGEWQVSRVYAVLNRPAAARYHAQRCLDLCEAHGIGGFDLGFAYEALARAHAVAGNTAEAVGYVKRGRELAATIAAQGDREYLESQLGTIPV